MVWRESLVFFERDAGNLAGKSGRADLLVERTTEREDVCCG